MTIGRSKRWLVAALFAPAIAATKVKIALINQNRPLYRAALRATSSALIIQLSIKTKLSCVGVLSNVKESSKCKVVLILREFYTQFPMANY